MLEPLVFLVRVAWPWLEAHHGAVDAARSIVQVVATFYLFVSTAMFIRRASRRIQVIITLGERAAQSAETAEDAALRCTRGAEHALSTRGAEHALSPDAPEGRRIVPDSSPSGENCDACCRASRTVD
jgi:hypothetical protein